MDSRLYWDIWEELKIKKEGATVTHQDIEKEYERIKQNEQTKSNSVHK